MRIASEERGQALILGVLVAAVGAVVISGLVLAQERLLTEVRAHRAGEAAAQAAGATVADEHLAFIDALRGSKPSADELAAEERTFLKSSSLSERALKAAQELSRENGVAPPTAVEIDDIGREISITIRQGGLFRVSIEKRSCCRR